MWTSHLIWCPSISLSPCHAYCGVASTRPLECLAEIHKLLCYLWPVTMLLPPITIQTLSNPLICLSFYIPVFFWAWEFSVNFSVPLFSVWVSGQVPRPPCRASPWVLSILLFQSHRFDFSDWFVGLQRKLCVCPVFMLFPNLSGNYLSAPNPGCWSMKGWRKLGNRLRIIVEFGERLSRIEDKEEGFIHSFTFPFICRHWVC